MQKKLIALAVAGLVSAPAFAQSNVTIYGVADAAMVFGEHGDNDLAAVESGGLSGSRLGFRGTEDLGNGLKAVFTYEQGFNIDGSDNSDGTRGLGGNSRQSFVGLSGAFGTVSLGRQYAPGYDFIADSFGSSPILSPQAILSGDAKSSIDASSDARWNNSIAYNGAFAGLKVRAIYSMGADVSGRTVSTELGNDPSEDDAAGLGLEYANGPLRLVAVYQYLQDGANTLASDDQQEWSVGGSYNFGFLTLSANYQDAEALGNVRGNDGDIWQVGVVVPVGAAGNVHLGYGEADMDVVDAKAKSYSIAYTHALSKRTTAYAGYNRTDNDTGLAYGAVDALTGVTGEEADVFAVGVRHTF
ncbi:Outer membrane porin protein 32 [Thauera sp. GDN1]|uniref:porin n=1 Tax=Thauera sp. GDN1 TaxID=2944810 RepID=UPI00247A97D8|nr:porin [Thauera sp. GDN1]WEN41150.1 Outer membrane porin protein 32 [Thauera sp. GDN1]